MKQFIYTIILLAFGVSFTAYPQDATNAQDTVVSRSTDTRYIDILGKVLNNYTPWERVTFNGKLRYDRLPLSPTVRIYAENGSLIQISVRVPLMGEIGRLELRPDEVLIVNKWKKTYVNEKLANLTETYPGLVSDLQSFLLGRIVIFGMGELDEKMVSGVDVIPAENGQWVIVPKELPMSGKLEYGYMVGPNGRTMALFGTMEGRPDNVGVEYIYAGNSMDMVFKVQTSKGTNEGTLDFSSIRWGGEPMTPVNLSQGYTRMSVKDFLKNIK